MPKTTEHNRGELMTDVAGRSSTRGLSFSSLLSAEIRIGCLISDKPFTMKCKLSSFQLEQMLNWTNVKKNESVSKNKWVFFPPANVYCTVFFVFLFLHHFSSLRLLVWNMYLCLFIFFLHTHTAYLLTCRMQFCRIWAFPNGPWKQGVHN